MKVTANVLLNYIRCRRYASLNDPDLDYTLSEYKLNSHDYYKDYIDMFYDIYFDDTLDIERNLKLSYDFHSDIQLQDKFHYYIEDRNELYYLMPTTSKDFLKLKYRVGKKKLQMFNKNKQGIYELKQENLTIIESNYLDKIKKLLTRTDDLGRTVYNYAFKMFLYNKVNPESNTKLYFVVLNSDYVYNGVNYTKDLYKVLDFSHLYKIYSEIIEADIYRMINHIELDDFTSCPLVKKECRKGDSFECKFVDFCFSHIPKYNSILNYFSSFRGFDEMTEAGIVNHDAYDLLNEGYVDILDLPISWLKDEHHLMQRYCAENEHVHLHKPKIKKILDTLKYPLIYLDFEASPCLLPRYKAEKPYSQSVFQYSIHIELEPGVLEKDGARHFEFIGKPNIDCRREIVENLIRICNEYNSSIIVYNKTFEMMRFRELQNVFPEYKEDIQKMIDRLFDLMDVVKTNKKLYIELGFSEEDAGRYNFYHHKLSGSYSLKKVISVFNESAYKNLNIQNGVQAYESFMGLENLEPTEYDNVIQDLLEYCKQDTYSMFEIIVGIKKLIAE